jgi:hypothetical protein
MPVDFSAPQPSIIAHPSDLSLNLLLAGPSPRTKTGMSRVGKRLAQLRERKVRLRRADE